MAPETQAADRTPARAPDRAPDRIIPFGGGDEPAIEVRIYRAARSVDCIVAAREGTWLLDVENNVGHLHDSDSVPDWIEEIGYTLGLKGIEAGR